MNAHSDSVTVQTDGIVVAGGDGLVSEVVSGLMDRNDGCMASGFPVGLVPSGTANAMANELDLFESESCVASPPSSASSHGPGR